MKLPRYDFIFPENFKGAAVIVEDMPCAEKSKVQNGRIQLMFPKNGIFLYRANIESNYMDNKYYLTDSNGNLIELFDFNWSASENEKSKPKSFGVDHKYSAVGNLYLPERYIFTYDVLTVGLRNDQDSIILSQDKIKELETLVKNCISGMAPAPSY